MLAQGPAIEEQLVQPKGPADEEELVQAEGEENKESCCKLRVQ